jgi:hypothetical protein
MYGKGDNTTNPSDGTITMTVSDQTNRTSAVGTGAEQVIPFTFPITANSDIVVTQRVVADGEETTLTETTNYTVINNGESGGSITTVTPFVANTAQVHIVRDTPNTQSLDLEQGGAFNAENVEDALDKNTKLTIESKDGLNRTLKFPTTDPASSFSDMPNSISRASKALTFDSSGKPTASVTVPTGSVSFSAIGTNIAEAANAETVRDLVELGTSDSPTFVSVTADLTGDVTGDVTGTLTGDVVGDSVKATSPWVDATHPDFGAVGDGVTDDTAAIQAALDAAMAVKGTCVLPPGTYNVSSSLNIYNPVIFKGLGRPVSKWNVSLGGSILRWTGDANSDVIVIGGTSSSVITESTYYIAEGITLENLTIIPDSDGDGRDGIVVDGSNTREANRGFCRDILINGCDVRKMGRYGLHTIGNVFNIRGNWSGFVKNVNTQFYNEDVGANVNIGVGNARQVYMYDCIFWSPAVGVKGAITDYTTFFGGWMQGNDGIVIGQHCNIFGSHLEGITNKPGDATIGILLNDSANCLIYPETVGNYGVGVQIGDGDSGQTTAYHGVIPTIQQSDVGIKITDGGQRSGYLKVSKYNDNTTNVEDDRLDTDGERQYSADFPRQGSDGVLVKNTKLVSPVLSFTNTDATPSVSLGNVFKTVGTTAITDFDDGTAGQVITVIAASSITITDGVNVTLAGGLDFAMVANDTIQLVSLDGTEWLEVSRSDNN